MVGLVIENNDHQGLGDWFPNLDKLPHGIHGLSKRIHDLGLKFGYGLNQRWSMKILTYIEIILNGY